MPQGALYVAAVCPEGAGTAHIVPPTVSVRRYGVAVTLGSWARPASRFLRLPLAPSPFTRRTGDAITLDGIGMRSRPRLLVPPSDSSPLNLPLEADEKSHITALYWVSETYAVASHCVTCAPFRQTIMTFLSRPSPIH